MTATVLDGRAKFGGHSAFRTWLFGVIRRTAAQERRRRWWLGRLRNGTREDEQPDATPTADDALERDEMAIRLEVALRELPRRQHEVLELVFYHEMTIEEAGAVIGVALGTARTHYERGKKNLLRRLESDEG